MKLVKGGLTIKGERQEEKEEKKKDYYLHERQIGSFERLPKKPEAIKPEKKIEVKTT